MKGVKLVILLFVMLLSLTSCNYSGEDTHKGEVALFYMSDDDAFSNEVRTELDYRFEDSGIKYSNYFCDDAQQQNEQIRKAVGNGAEIVIVDVSDKNSADVLKSITDVCEKKKIPVIYFNTHFDEEITTSYKKAAAVYAEIDEDEDSIRDSKGTAHTILKIIDNFVNGREKLFGIDEDYTEDNFSVMVPTIDKDEE